MPLQQVQDERGVEDISDRLTPMQRAKTDARMKMRTRSTEAGMVPTWNVVLRKA